MARRVKVVVEKHADGYSARSETSRQERFGRIDMAGFDGYNGLSVDQVSDQY
jgi:hypothetical protein